MHNDVQHPPVHKKKDMQSPPMREFIIAMMGGGVLPGSHFVELAYLSGTVLIMPTLWVFGGRCHCCLICAH